MHFAIDVASLGELADPRRIATLARAAEEAGWDGISVWDHLGTGMGVGFADPFVALAAAAAVTERVRLIASVIAVPRRRPQLVAQSAATLDLLSGGRFTLGAGSGGDPTEFEAFGEDPDPAVRAARLDEALAVIDRLLRGETAEATGPTYVVRGVRVGPGSVQQPRPPIWIGGTRPGALRRAARWDGWVGQAIAPDGSIAMPFGPEDTRASIDRIEAERSRIGRSGAPLDVALLGYSDPGDDHVVERYRRAGVTWWMESLHLMRGSFESLLERVAAGPPAVA